MVFKLVLVCVAASLILKVTHAIVQPDSQENTKGSNLAREDTLGQLDNKNAGVSRLIDMLRSKLSDHRTDSSPRRLPGDEKYSRLHAEILRVRRYFAEFATYIGNQYLFMATMFDNEMKSIKDGLKTSYDDMIENSEKVAAYLVINGTNASVCLSSAHSSGDQVNSILDSLNIKSISLGLGLDVTKLLQKMGEFYSNLLGFCKTGYQRSFNQMEEVQMCVKRQLEMLELRKQHIVYLTDLALERVEVKLMQISYYAESRMDGLMNEATVEFNRCLSVL